MFRLIKLGIYVLLGYALYEMYQGMLAESGGAGGGQTANRRGASRITGGGQGRRERTGEYSGASGSHEVGRGVVQ